jgi:hypothetical protein
MKRLGVVLVLGLLLAVPVIAQEPETVEVGGHTLTLPDEWALSTDESGALYEANIQFRPTVLVHEYGAGATIVSASRVPNLDEADLEQALNLALREIFFMQVPESEIIRWDIGGIEGAIFTYQDRETVPRADMIGTLGFVRLPDGAPIIFITYIDESQSSNAYFSLLRAESLLFEAIGQMTRTVSEASASEVLASGSEQSVLPEGWALAGEDFQPVFRVDQGRVSTTNLLHETGLVAMVASTNDLLDRLPELRNGVTVDLFTEIRSWDNEGHYQGDGFSYFKQVARREAIHFPYFDADTLPGTDIHGEMYLIETDSVPLFVWFYARRDAFDLEGLTMERAQHLLLYALTRDSLVPTCSISAKSESVSMHVGPSRDRAVFGYLPIAQRFTVSSRAVDAAGEAWYRIDPLDIAPDVLAESLWVAEADLSLGDRFCRQLSMPDDFVPIERVWWLSFDNTAHIVCENGGAFWQDQDNVVSNLNTLSFLNNNEQGIFFHAIQFVRQPDGSYVGERLENVDDGSNTEQVRQTYRMFFEGENHSTGITSYAFEANGAQCELNRAFIATTD